MKNKNEKLMSAFDHIDSRYIGEAMEYYGEKTAKKPVFAQKMNRFVAVASAAAACLLIIALALPSLLIERDTDSYTPTDVRAENTNSEVQTPPEHDGSKGLLYEINEDGKSASFVGFGTCTEETVVIASTYDGLPVVEAYLGEYRAKKESNNEYVIIGDIRDYGSKYVKNLIFSDTIEKIDEIIIESSPNIESIYFGAKVNKIIHCWAHENKIAKIEVSPENKTFMSRDNCIIEIATKKLFAAANTAIIPDDGSIEIIGMFSCQTLPTENLVIPEGVKKIESGAFSHNPNLKSVVLPTTLEYLSSAFRYCTKLEVIDLNGYAYLPDVAFSGNTSLVEIKGTENLIEIGHHALSQCDALNSISLGTCLRKIEKDAFSYYWYDWMGSYINIHYAGTRAEWDAIEKEDEWNYRSPDLKVYCTDETFTPASNLEKRGVPVNG